MPRGVLAKPPLMDVAVKGGYFVIGEQAVDLSAMKGFDLDVGPDVIDPDILQQLVNEDRTSQSLTGYVDGASSPVSPASSDKDRFIGDELGNQEGWFAVTDAPHTALPIMARVMEGAEPAANKSEIARPAAPRVDFKPNTDLSFLEFVRRNVPMTFAERVKFGLVHFWAGAGEIFVGRNLAQGIAVKKYQKIGDAYRLTGRQLHFFNSGAPGHPVPTHLSDNANLKAIAAYTAAIDLLEHADNNLLKEWREFGVILIDLYRGRREARQALSFYEPITNGQLDIDTARINELTQSLEP